MANVLYFEGAGMDFYGEAIKQSDVGNFRIRTAFTNNDGKKIYIELGNGARWGYKSTRSKKKTCISKWALHISHMHEITDGDDDENKNRISHDRQATVLLDYSKEDITKWINENLNCSFDTIEVLGDFYGYRVHGDNRTYNFMEEIELNHDRAGARKQAYELADEAYREALGERYSIIGRHGMDADSLTIRCYASDEALAKTGLPRMQRIEVTY